MGANRSIPVSINPQTIPICATDPRFCLPHNVELHLKEKYSSMSGGDFTIMDANNQDISYFQCEGRVFSLCSRKILRDDVGVPVLERSYNKIKIFAGDGSTRKIGFRSQKSYAKTKLLTVFPDVLNGGIQRRLMLRCHSDSKICTISLGDPKHGGVPVAQIFSPRLRTYGNDFIVEIAANVDIAICVMMCIDLVAPR